TEGTWSLRENYQGQDSFLQTFSLRVFRSLPCFLLQRVECRGVGQERYTAAVGWCSHQRREGPCAAVRCCCFFSPSSVAVKRPIRRSISVATSGRSWRSTASSVTGSMTRPGKAHCDWT